MKKLLSVMLLVSLTASLVAACGSTKSDSANTDKSNGSTTKSEKVVAWAWDPSFNGAALKIAEELYKKEHPGFELEIVDMAKTDLEQKLNTNLAAGVKEGLPDIILVNDPNIQKYVTSYPNTFADFTDKVDFSQFSSYKVDALRIDDKVYGVPFDIGVTGMFYRSDYLEQAGYKAEDLENITWDEYIEIGKVVKEKTGKYMATINPNDEALTSILLQSGGSWYITPENKGNFVDNPAMTDTLRIYKAIADSGIAKPVTGWSEFVGSFNAGDVATVVSGVWQVASIMDAKDQSGKWKVAPIPRLSVEGAVNASNEGGSSWFVLDGSANKDLAIDFLAKTIGGSSEFYERFLNENGGVGSYIPSFSSEAYSQTSEFFGGQAIYSDFTKWSTEVPGITLGMYTQEAKDALKNELPNILNGADLTQSLANIQKLFEQQVQ
ncbi:lactose/L-arabinose transport system substrate-binding protein [Paenibacillus anaericanus]|uniref:Extracellular solute-binding protein n=1 Tax=Paenibacillus anaericanus TaxID=170367 RepID=A0A3S1DHT2_9BACL|nr:extracellular solute-binding protein [Paenibacillus anaericanus]MDQ0089594.1 lactose/L-arabinose transport system substrate-binding protein [Paenibacillus anaericanus]RUT41473.1 extracellular solute-binding protein [Paenibacillus anaericanus]